MDTKMFSKLGDLFGITLACKYELIAISIL